MSNIALIDVAIELLRLDDDKPSRGHWRLKAGEFLHDRLSMADALENAFVEELGWIDRHPKQPDSYLQWPRKSSNERIAELENTVNTMRQEIEQHHAAHHELQQRLMRVYDERNALVISLARLALAAGYRAGWGTDSNEQSDPEWRTVVYVQFDGVAYRDQKVGFMGCIPDFQLSWHMAPDWQTAAQANLPAFDGQWDGTFLGREPADYVGQVPTIPHLSQITSVTLPDLEKFQALTPGEARKKLLELQPVEAHAARNEDGTYRVQLGSLVTPRAGLTPGGVEGLKKGEADKVHKAAARLKTLIDLCGHAQNGSDTTVSLFQDDATGACFVRTGDIPATRSWWGASFGEAIDLAEKDRSKWDSLHDN